MCRQNGERGRGAPRSSRGATPGWLERDAPAREHLGSTRRSQDGELWLVSSMATGRRGDVAQLKSETRRGVRRRVSLRSLLEKYVAAARVTPP